MYRVFVSGIVLLWTTSAGAQTRLANPASVNCTQLGGTLTIDRRPDGGEFGVCVFADNHQCEEWALLRGECPKSGVRVTGFVSAAGRYCAITGGRYSVVSVPGATAELGTCRFPSGTVCDADAYYAGSCSGR